MKKVTKKIYVVDESVESTFFYHFREQGGFKSLCGRVTLGKELPESHWDFRSHIPYQYCLECRLLRDKDK
jgi:hypothetical protein